MGKHRTVNRGDRAGAASWLAIACILGLILQAGCRGPSVREEPPAPPDTGDLYEEVDEGPDTVQYAQYEESNEFPYVLTGTLLLSDGPADGGIRVRDGVILDVWQGAVPDGFKDLVRIETNGLILPGFIDLHNHVAYNFLPEWKPGRLFKDRYEWQKAAAYKKAVSEPYGALKKKGLLDEMNKYGEVRALVGGTTSILGDAPSPGSGILVRNIDQNTLTGDYMRSHVGWVEEFGCSRGKPDCPGQADEIAKLNGSLASGKIKAMAFHVAEGAPDDPESRSEFKWLRDHQLVRKGVIVTHGTALGAAEFQEMAAQGMSLVWSPRSNISLYGTTTDVRAARQAGVKIALAPDWSPSGSDNMLAELRYAAAYNRNRLGGLFGARELVAMATSVPAELAGREDRLGSIAKGYVADLLVLSKQGGDPYESVLKSDERHVLLVTVNGVPLYGEEEWLDRLGKAGDHEPIVVRGVTKAIDTTVPKAYPKGKQRFAEIRDILMNAYASYGTMPTLTANEP